MVFIGYGEYHTIRFVTFLLFQSQFQELKGPSENSQLYCCGIMIWKLHVKYFNFWLLLLQYNWKIEVREFWKSSRGTRMHVSCSWAHRRGCSLLQYGPGRCKRFTLPRGIKAEPAFGVAAVDVTTTNKWTTIFHFDLSWHRTHDD